MREPRSFGWAASGTILFTSMASAVLFAGDRRAHAEPAAMRPMTFRVEFRWALKNRLDRPLENVRVYIPVPESCAYQEIERLEWVMPDKAVARKQVKDRFGQTIAEFMVAGLAPQALVEVGFTCRFKLKSGGKISLDSRRAGTLADIPKEIRTLYTSDLKGVYDLESSEIRTASANVTKPHRSLVDQVLAIHDLVGTMQYKRDTSWDSAAVVLARKTGSCSEFSYLFCALCRAAGIPTRFVGGTTCRLSKSTTGPFTDDVYHRWVEVYIPPYGWVPFDATRDRGRPAKRTHVGAHPYPALILSRGGGGSEYLRNQYIGWSSHGPLMQQSRRFIWTIER